MTPTEILDLPMEGNESGASTVRGYLITLLSNLWQEGEGFSGKRPFGNSGWEYDLYRPLVVAGLIQGCELDEDGFIGAMEAKAIQEADHLIARAIRALH